MNRDSASYLLILLILDMHCYLDVIFEVRIWSAYSFSSSSFYTFNWTTGKAAVMSKVFLFREHIQLINYM